jgi:hypothetical protein
MPFVEARVGERAVDGHLAMISHPAEVTELITTAAQSA